MRYEHSNIQYEFEGTDREKFIVDTRKLIDRNELSQEAPKKWEDDPHITVLFGLNSGVITDEMANIIETYPPFVCELGGLSLFTAEMTKKPFAVVKADVISTDLHVLNRLLRDNCDYTETYPDYKPHVTVAYVQPGTHGRVDGHPVVKGMKFMVNQLTFSSHMGFKKNIMLGIK